MMFHKVLITILVVAAVAVSNVEAIDVSDCTGPVPFPDPEDCTSYYKCFLTPDGYVLVHSNCPPGGIWWEGACVEGTCGFTTVVPMPTTEGQTTPAEETTVAATTSPADPTTGPAELTTSPADPTTENPPTNEPTTEEAITTTVTATPPTNPPTFQCPSEGLFPHPTDPKQYYQCVLIGSQFYYYIYSCPTNSCFQQTAGRCVIGSCPGSPTTTPPPATTTTKPTTTTPKSTTTAKTLPPNPCPSEGLFPNPTDCQLYYQCVRISGRMYISNYLCPAGSWFSGVYKLCVLGTCPGSPTTTPPPTTTTTKPTTTTTKTTTTTSKPTTTTSKPTTTTSKPTTTTTKPTTTTTKPTSTTTTTPKPTTTTTKPTTTTAKTLPPNPCPSEGLFPNPDDCQAYYQCVRISGRMYIYNYRCQAGSWFSVAHKRCVLGTCPAK